MPFATPAWAAKQNERVTARKSSHIKQRILLF
jgi:hypothetical protein